MKNLKNIYKKRFLAYLHKNIDLNKTFTFSKLSSSLYLFVSSSVFFTALLLLCMFVDAVFNIDAGIISGILLFTLLAIPFSGFWKKTSVKRMNEVAREYLYGEKQNNITDLFFYDEFIDDHEEYYQNYGLSQPQLKGYMIEKEDLSVIKDEIISLIGSDNFSEILNEQSIRQLIKEQGGVSWYCMFFIIKKIEKNITEENVDELFSVLTEKKTNEKSIKKSCDLGVGHVELI